MALLGIVGANAGLLFIKEAARLYSDAVSAHPRRGRKVPHPEVATAERILIKARAARKRLSETGMLKIYIPPGHQIDQIDLALQRLREDPAATRRLAPKGVDDVFVWLPDKSANLLALDIIA